TMPGNLHHVAAADKGSFPIAFSRRLSRSDASESSTASTPERPPQRTTRVGFRLVCGRGRLITAFAVPPVELGGTGRDPDATNMSFREHHVTKCPRSLVHGMCVSVPGDCLVTGYAEG